jgi:hypothetical protein
MEYQIALMSDKWGKDRTCTFDSAKNFPLETHYKKTLNVSFFRVSYWQDRLCHTHRNSILDHYTLGKAKPARDPNKDLFQVKL